MNKYVIEKRHRKMANNHYRKIVRYKHRKESLEKLSNDFHKLCFKILGIPLLTEEKGVLLPLDKEAINSVIRIIKCS